MKSNRTVFWISALTVFFLLPGFWNQPAFSRKIKTGKVPPFEKFLSRFPKVFCQQSDQCENAFFLTGKDCEGYLAKQISEKYRDKKFRVSNKKVDACLVSLAASTCDALKASVPKTCDFLNRLD